MRKGGWLKLTQLFPLEQAQAIERPASLAEPAFCDIIFSPIQSLPSWEGLNELHADAPALAEVLNEENPWDAYEEAATQPSRRVGLSIYARGLSALVAGGG